MAYNEFAYFYDSFNEDADYDALYRHVKAELDAHGIRDGILADLGCGTGELTLMLAQAGYDMIAIDQSEEMLCVVRDKADQLELTGRLLLLEQDLCSLDLYGTIRAGPVQPRPLRHHPGGGVHLRHLQPPARAGQGHRQRRLLHGKGRGAAL